MLGKLMKYDLKWIYKVVAVFYILSLVFSVFTRVFGSIDNSTLFGILEKISAGIAISMIISGLINCLMRSWARFIVNIYKDESYLTHTLPISKKTIYLSKVLSSIICTFITVIVGVICLVICYYSKENLDALKGFLELTANAYDTTVIKFLLVVSLVFFLEVVFMLMIGYNGIILGHRSNKNKMVKTLIISFGLYMITSGLILAGTLIVGLFDSDVMNIIKSTDTVSMDAIKSVMYVAVVLYIIADTALYFVGKRQLEKGVNVD